MSVYVAMVLVVMRLYRVISLFMVCHVMRRAEEEGYWVTQLAARALPFFFI